MHDNPFVDMLNEFHPFNASNGISFSELDKGFFAAPSRLDVYLKEFVKRSQIRLIVLTGNAGQGKTFLCRRLLEGLGMDLDEANEMIATSVMEKPSIMNLVMEGNFG